MSATRGRQAVLDYAHDATVFRGFGREVSAETDHVSCRAAVVTLCSACHLCRAGLSAHLEQFASVSCLFAEAYADNVVQTELYVLQGRGLAHLLYQHFCREFAYYLSVLHFGLYEFGFHYLAAVGNAVVEGQGAYHRLLRYISNAHPGQVGLAPVAYFAVWLRYYGFALAHEGEVQGDSYSQSAQTVHIPLGVILVCFVYYAAYTDIAALFQNL